MEKDRNNTEALYALGRIYYQQNRFPEAVEQLKRVVELEPDNYKAHDNLALAYDALWQDADALRHFFKALDLVKKDHPDYDWAYSNFAGFFLRRDQFEKAFQLAVEATKRNPNSPRNFFLTGKALTKLGKDENAVRWLERAVELDPGYHESWYLLGQTYRKLGRNAEAKAALERFEEARQNPRPRR